MCCVEHIAEKKRGSRPETMDCTPPDYIMPGGKERPLLPLHPVDKEMKVRKMCATSEANFRRDNAIASLQVTVSVL